MKSASEIESRIRFLLVQELDTRIRAASLRLPHVCVHNYRHPVDVRKRVDGEPNPNYNRIALPVLRETIGLCMLLDAEGQPMDKPDPERWGGTICEEPIDAQRCPYFTPTVTKATLLSEFAAQIKDVAWLQGNLPEVAGLLWALESVSVSTIPWWKRLLYRWLRINVEPLRVTEDPGKLLGA